MGGGPLRGKATPTMFLNLTQSVSFQWELGGYVQATKTHTGQNHYPLARPLPFGEAECLLLVLARILLIPVK